jgi:tetratricopeptide (TPR) repeat protein
MLIRGIEHNKRIPSAYLLIGKSHFFKNNYALSIIALQHIVREYETDDAFEAKVWIAKNHVFARNLDQASVTLNELKKDLEDGRLNRSNRQLLNLVNTDFLLKQENYREAIPFLKDAINDTRNKRERTRFTYILAQLYQEIEDFGNAQQTFAQVLKMKPTFDLEFQARISMATAFDPATGNSQAVYAELNRMLGQKRNQAFKDRIYYAMAQLALRENNEAKAIDLFKKSIENSVDNRMQKGLSFLKLGELYFIKPQYLKSSEAYDSTIVFLPGNFDNINEIRTRQMILAELARNIRVVEREDSLQKLAAMPPNERNQIVDRIIAEYREEQRRLEQERQDLGTSAYMTTRMRTDFAGETGWYFYNRNTMVAGSAEFSRRFGNRPLEDLWRIGNKQMMSMDFGTDEEFSTEDGEQGPRGTMDRASLLQNIPLTAEKLEESNIKIAQALFNKGMLHIERLNDKTSAVKAFERLVNQFSNDKNVLHAYYYLINTLEETGQQSLAATYRTKLLNDYPESDFARVLKDPNFRRTLLQQKDAADFLYEETYNAFVSNNFNKVFENVIKANEFDLRANLRAQFKYLKALSHGKQGQQDLLKNELTEIVQDFSGSIVHQPAQILLASMGMPVVALDKLTTPTEQVVNSRDDQTQMVTEETKEQVNYKISNDGLHFLVVIVDVNRIDVTQFTDYIKQFNEINFRDRRLIVTNVFFDENRQIVTVSSFDNKTRGMQYFRSIGADPGLRVFQSDAFAKFIISVDNYATFYQSKNVGQYLRFFNENF